MIFGYTKKEGHLGGDQNVSKGLRRICIVPLMSSEYWRSVRDMLELMGGGILELMGG